MNCRYCSKNVDDGSSFCPYCGNKVGSENKGNDKENVACYVFGYFPILFWIPLVMKNKTLLSKQIANQGLILLLAHIIGDFAFSLLKNLFRFTVLNNSFGWAISTVATVYGILLFIFMIIGMVNAGQKVLYRIPLIGNLNLIK